MTADRLKTPLAAIIEAILPRLIYLATWEYRVLTATPGPPAMIDCQAVDPGTEAALPQHLTQLTLWPGPSGGVAVPKPGTIVRVAFVNGDPTKPAVVGFDPASSPTLVMLDGAPGPFVSRVGDEIQFTVTSALAAAITAPSSGGPCSVTPGPPVSISGTITSGSTKVQSP